MRRVVVVSHTYIAPANRGKLRALAARGFDVTVGVPQRWREASLGQTLELGWERQNGVELFPIPAPGHESPEGLRFGRRALLALLRDKRPDLVQVEEEPTTLAARQVVRVARQLKLPTVLFTHHNVDVAPPLLVGWRRKRTLRRLRGAIAGSEAAAAVVRRIVPGLTVGVIPQLGVQVPTTPEHAHHEGLAIGYVGRLVPEKGVDTLLEALAAIRTLRWHLTIVGDGPERERLERLASEHRLAARVRWTGALPPDAVPKVWPELDVLVLPSRALPTWAEPAAHVLAEAMAYEVAVVGTSAGATPEVIGDAGVVVPPEDPAALAAALRQLAAPDARQGLAQAGRARAMQLLSEDAVAERTAEFWRALLG
ncbi:MAG TPA: glycosyltransferase [Gemmatimonadales bacterium]|jgi:glycosyltransferase involved in cell wall biosynthesis|nr:glycosyltransferase [Gemmatimonadales bacterium]